jgi:amino acid adenylation domain-containing protein
MMKTVIHSVFEQVAERFADNTAIEEPGRTITYRALNEAANRAAHGLVRSHGVEPGDVVGLHLPVGIDYVVSLLAVAKCGGVYLPLDLAAPPQRQHTILEKAAARVVISEHSSELPRATVTSTLAGLHVDNGENLPLGVDGDAGCYLVFTSGSTGEPKAILGSQKGLSHFIHWEIGEFELSCTARVSQLAAPTFDVSLRDIFVPLLAGGTLCVPPDEARTSSRQLLAWLEAARVSLMHCVPSLFRQLTAEVSNGPSPSARVLDLQHVLLAGEPLYGADVEKWRSSMGERVELVNLYGPSETTLAKAFYRIADTPIEPNRMVPVGNPLPNSALLVIKDGELCDEGEIGEVFIKTPFMSKGYLYSEELNQSAFVPNPLTPGVLDVVYRSGDIGRYLVDHVVELLGRRDGQVKVNGIRIELAEVEAAVMHHPSVESAVVVAHQSPSRELSLAAYFVASEPLTPASLRTSLTDWLPTTMHPAYFVQMEQLPLNLHGKVNRRALPQPIDLLYESSPYVAPENSTETELATLWCDVLGLPKVGVTHSFVDLGGDSLKAIRLLSRIYISFGVEANLRELFPDGSVRGLAASLSKGAHQAREFNAAAVAPSTGLSTAVASRSD